MVHARPATRPGLLRPQGRRAGWSGLAPAPSVASDQPVGDQGDIGGQRADWVAAVSLVLGARTGGRTVEHVTTWRRVAAERLQDEQKSSLLLVRPGRAARLLAASLLSGESSSPPCHGQASTAQAAEPRRAIGVPWGAPQAASVCSQIPAVAFQRLEGNPGPRSETASQPAPRPSGRGRSRRPRWRGRLRPAHRRLGRLDGLAPTIDCALTENSPDLGDGPDLGWAWSLVATRTWAWRRSAEPGLARGWSWRGCPVPRRGGLWPLWGERALPGLAHALQLSRLSARPVPARRGQAALHARGDVELRVQLRRGRVQLDSVPGRPGRGLVDRASSAARPRQSTNATAMPWPARPAGRAGAVHVDLLVFGALAVDHVGARRPRPSRGPRRRLPRARPPCRCGTRALPARAAPCPRSPRTPATASAGWLSAVRDLGHGPLGAGRRPC